MADTVSKRVYELNIETLGISGLSIEFNIARNLKAESNTAEFTINNLSETSRRTLQTVKGGVTVKFLAGYKPKPSLLFLGKLREVTSARQGATWVTKVSSGDGDGKSGHVSFSIGPGGSLAKAIERTIGELQQGIGNALSAVKGGEFLSGTGATFPRGAVVHGRADVELDRLLRSMGKTYSVQNGDVQILDNGKATNQTAHVVSQENGLVGSPEIGAIKNAAGTSVRNSVKFRSLLTGEIFPGRQVKIESSLVSGFYRVQEAVYSGQSHGPDWYVDVQATPVRP